MNESSFQKAIENNDPILARAAFPEIDSLLSQATDPNEKAYLLFSKSTCYGILGDFSEARKYLSSALRQQPDDPHTRLTFDFNGGLLSQREGKYREALDAFTAVVANYAETLKSSDLRFMFEEIQQRRAFLSATVREFQSAIPSRLGAGQTICFEAALSGLQRIARRRFIFFLEFPTFMRGPLPQAKA